MDENKFTVDENAFSDEEKQETTPQPEKQEQEQIKDSFTLDEVKDLKPAKKEKKQKKSSSTLKNVIWILIIVIVSVGIAFGIIYAGADYLGIGFGRGKDVEIDIPEGTSTVVIADKLSESGAVKIPILFRLYSKLNHFDSQYKYGVYTFNNELGYQGLADMLITEGMKAKTETVRIPEGNIDAIAKALEDKGICKTSEFIDVVQHENLDYDFVKEIPADSVYYRLEGYLYPETYSFYVTEDGRENAKMAVKRMLNEFEEKIKPYRDKINEGKYSLHQITTMASIIQLEAGNTKTVSDEDRAKVSAIFYNRLDSKDFATLGSSPTRKYPHGNGRYNTYECNGLPPGPLCSMNIQSFKAAVEPSTEMDGYYYFVTDAAMKFYYRKTLNEHNAIIAKLKAEKNWIYEE